MPYAIKSSELAEFQKQLIGKWSNDENDKNLIGKDGKPLSYNVMPLPQVEPQKGYPCCLGYILKNFSFTEEIKFNGADDPSDPLHEKDPDALAVIAGAPNRGGRYTQSSHAVFYEQKVRFAEGPQGPTGAKTQAYNKAKKRGDVVHVENGAWLHLQSVEQKLGPYDDHPAVPGPIIPQAPEMAIAKQIAVPHGNSVLALGSFTKDVQKGAPHIPDMQYPYPTPLKYKDDFPSWDISAYPYYTKLVAANDYENPDLNLTFNPNLALQEAVKAIKPNAYLYWVVHTDPVVVNGKDLGTGYVTNIPFEQRRANVNGYKAEYWLLSTDHGKSFDYLAYNQCIELQIPILGEPYIFPHVTANTVKRV
jgi:hypothetical protein